MQERRELRFGTDGYQNKLSFPQREGYMRRIVNLKGDRVARLQRLGWSVVSDSAIQIGDAAVSEMNTEIDGAVVTVDQGTGMKACLMEIPLDIYQADQAIKAESIRETESQMRRSVPQGADYRREDNKIE